MKAAVWHARNDIRIENVPDPEPPGFGELMLKVLVCGICSTDLEEYRAGPIFIPVAKPHPLTNQKAPVILGHEFVGEIIAVGEGITDFYVGQLVIPDVVLYCGSCYWCNRHEYMLCEKQAALGLSANGGLAQFCKVPASMCIVLPPGTPLELGVLAEPLSVSVRAIRKAGIRVGDSVAIFGAGMQGLLSLQVAQNVGAKAVYVVEPLKGRREIALQLGATEVINPVEVNVSEALKDLTKIGPDIVIEVSGAVSAAPAAIESVRKGGRVVLVGIPVASAKFNFFIIVSGEKEVVGALGHVYDEDFLTAVDMIGSGKISKFSNLLDKSIPLSQLISVGFRKMEQEPSSTLKVLVDPQM